MGAVWLGSWDLRLPDCTAGCGMLPSQPAQGPAPTAYFLTPCQPHGTGHVPEPWQSGWAAVVVLTFGVHSWDSGGCSGLIFQPDVHELLME